MEKNDDCPDRIQELVILQRAVESTNNGFVTIDEDHRILFFNRAAARIFGYSREEVVGKDLDVILVPRCSKDHHKAVAAYLKDKKRRITGHQRDLIATRKNGETFPALISFSVAEVDGRSFFTGIVRDMTETAALQGQIFKAERLAALGQVIAEITHEIKVPLTVIGGLARQLIKTTKGQESVSKLKVITEEVRRLENFVVELNEYYLPRTLTIERFDINSLLREIYSATKDDCQERDIRLLLKTDDEPVLVEGDKDRLRQVFFNLVRNGIEAMEDGGNLSIESVLTRDKVEVTIADDGPGIPEDDHERIFTPFFTTKTGGTGLGLSLSKRIVEDHKGPSLSLTSRVGKGTAFKITVPSAGTN
ncbi:MAG: ATP-binding protein [Pseudomonadota bacterium]